MNQMKSAGSYDFPYLKGMEYLKSHSERSEESRVSAVLKRFLDSSLRSE
ncbi:MAG: hypothetical protein GX121_04990 [Ignavibacteria bacterium]|jgi:hypothetical protein|nr:hypothetical protein [Ignavibacteria bacterium]